MTRLRAFGASARHAGIRACGATATPTRLRGFLLVAALGLLAARPAAAQTEIVEYYGHDALGSIRIVFTASGVATARADYEPFGEAVIYEMLFRLTAAFGRSNPNIVDPNSPMTGRTLNTPLGQVWVHVYNGTIRNAGINPRGSYR